MSDLFVIGSYIFEMEDGKYWLHIRSGVIKEHSEIGAQMDKALPMIRAKARSKKDAEALLTALAESLEPKDI